MKEIILEDGFKIESGMVAKMQRGENTCHVLYYKDGNSLKSINLDGENDFFGAYDFSGDVISDIVEVYQSYYFHIPAGFLVCKGVNTDSAEVKITGSKVWAKNKRVKFEDLNFGDKFIYMTDTVYTKLRGSQKNIAVDDTFNVSYWTPSLLVIKVED